MYLTHAPPVPVQMVLLTGCAGCGKSALLAEAVGRLHGHREGEAGAEAPMRVLVGQSSALLQKVSPLYTARQWLQRWQAPGQPVGQVAARILKSAGLAEAAAPGMHTRTHTHTKEGTPW